MVYVLINNNTGLIDIVVGFGTLVKNAKMDPLKIR